MIENRFYCSVIVLLLSSYFLDHPKMIRNSDFTPRGCVGWLQKRTNLEKRLLSLSSLLFLTLFLMIVIGIAFKGNQSGDSSDENEVCWSGDCIKAAGDVLASMQSSTDSCSDFYHFACGRYGQEPGQTTSVSERSTESVYFLLKNILESNDKLDIDGLHDVKSFYNSCVQFGSYQQDAGETRASFLNLMTDMGIGTWPIIDSLYDTSEFSLERTLVNLVLLDVPVVFKMEIVPDELLTSSYIIKISPGGPRESGRSSSEIRDDNHLRSSVLASFLLLGASTRASTNVDDILSVDGSFADIQQEKSTQCDDVTLIAPQEATIMLERLIPEINWSLVLSEFRKATGLRSSFAVKLHCKFKIRDYVTYLNDLTVRSEMNYLGWRFFSKFVEHVIPTFEKSHFGTGEVVPRWRVCLEWMEKFASPVLADVLTHKMMKEEMKEKLYKQMGNIERKWKETSISPVESLSECVLSASKSLVSSASWLSDSHKSRIREKVDRIRIRYPFHKEDLNGDLPIRIPQVDVSNFTAVVIQRQRQWEIEKFKRLGKDAEVWDAPEPWRPVLSARSDSLTRDSTAYVYFDKLTSPYIRQHGSRWLHFGGFGVSVAREISRVLMSMNSGGSAEGNSKLWKVWLQSKNSSACFNTSLMDRLEEAEETEKWMQDRFLDQSALEIAYEAALTFDSSEPDALPGVEWGKDKLFFLAYAQTLCNANSASAASEDIPVQERLKSVLFHFDLFKKAFSCENSPLQCLIWA